MQTLAEHAEAWYRERGRNVPPRNTPAWEKMYLRWARWAFARLHD